MFVQAFPADLCFMKTAENKLPTPPWDMDTAAERLRSLAEDFNSAAPEKIIGNFTENAEVRFGLEFLNGRDEIRQFLVREFAHKYNYTLRLDLWGALKGRMAVRSELEWTDPAGQQFKNFGVQVFQFNDEGLIELNYLSFNDTTDLLI